ncbi:hypothetical protein CE489_20020 [Bacillus spizizenii]|uniref:hypothetical protein n=1 Tax=Bacillus spizizenii TaxID=96241 RepID=UPI000B531179|nr:hypothetical protein [Bacillus spizizenii]OWV35172.1 hypothetical protein CE489_20020 [Bacillus spizizenii]
MLTCNEFYLEISNKSKDIVNQSFLGDNYQLLSTNHSFITDLEVWLEALNNRPEIELYEIAFREYQFSLIQVSQGFYRQSFNALRFFIEHTLAGIYFSFQELDLRLWKLGEKDINWSNIINEDNGIFSKGFFKAFSPMLIGESITYSDISKKIYRECSEYVHGNYVTREKLSTKLEFNQNSFEIFNEKAKIARTLIVFSLCARYLDCIDHGMKARLESSIMDHVGNIKGIQTSFQVQKENV